MKLGGVDIWRIELDRITATISILSTSEQERINRFQTETLRQRGIAVRNGLRNILGGYLDCRPGEIEFKSADNGKPYLATKKITFNLSHSGPFALIAVHQQEQLGIDIEKIKQRNNISAIASRVLPPATVEILNSITEPEQRNIEFTRAWTAFEARQKMTGNGIFGEKALPHHLLYQFHPTENWCASLAVANGDSAMRINFFDYPNRKKT